jgi:hypothetical protein
MLKEGLQMNSASDRELCMVEFQERDPETGNYLVKKLPDGEVVSVPSASAIAVVKIQRGQLLVLFHPKGSPHGCLLAPI